MHIFLGLFLKDISTDFLDCNHVDDDELLSDTYAYERFNEWRATRICQSVIFEDG